MDLFIDIVIISMLLVTIVYAWRLNGKLNTIKNHKAELKANIEAFYQATDKATNAVDTLKKEGEKVCKEINERISKARITADEMDFLVNRMNKKVMQANEQGGSVKGEVKNFEPKDFSASKGFAPKKTGIRSISEQELIDALREKQSKEAMVN